MLNLIEYSPALRNKNTTFSDVKDKIKSKAALQFLQFQQEETRNPSFFSFMICSSHQYPKVQQSFKKGFLSMSLPEKKQYFQRNLNFTNQILTNELELRDRQNLERDHQAQLTIPGKALLSTEQMNNEWKQTTIIGNKYLKTLQIELLHKTVDLHAYILRFSKNDEEIIVLEPIKPYLEKMKFKPLDYSWTEIKQKVTILMEDTQRESMAELLGKKDIYEKRAPLNMNDLLLQMMNPEALMSLAASKVLQDHHDTQQTVSGVKTDLLHFKHFYDPQPKTQPARLVANGSQHYFLREDWRITKDGTIQGINQEKIDYQSDAMKYVMKKVFFGGSISNISLPIQIYGNQTSLYRLLQCYRDAPLLIEEAVQLTDPVARFKKVIGFAMTNPTIYNKMDKPLAPVLGETCQLVVNGTVFCGQQVCEQPPISAILIKGRGYTMWGHFEEKLDLGFNKATGSNDGWMNISFDESDCRKKIVKYTSPVGEMHGTMVGSPYFNFIDSQYFVDQDNLLFCKIRHGHGQDRSRPDAKYQDCIQGQLVRVKSKDVFNRPQKITSSNYTEVLGMIHGRWTNAVYFQQELIINTLTESPLQLDPYPSILRSDSTLRKALILRIEGKFDEAQIQKEKTEAQQKLNAELRKKYLKQHKK